MNSEFVAFPPKPVTRELYLIGFRVDPSAEVPQFYTLMGEEGESERPIAKGGRVLFFAHPHDALRALAASDNGFADFRPVPRELELLCDIGGALYVANAEPTDADGILFEAIAVFDDLLSAAKISVPPEYSRVLRQVAERLGESAEFASVLGEGGREKLEDALMWCVGAVMVKSTWVK